MNQSLHIGWRNFNEESIALDTADAAFNLSIEKGFCKTCLDGCNQITVQLLGLPMTAVQTLADPLAAQGGEFVDDRGAEQWPGQLLFRTFLAEGQTFLLTDTRSIFSILKKSHQHLLIDQIRGVEGGATPGHQPNDLRVGRVWIRHGLIIEILTGLLNLKHGQARLG